MKNMKKVLIAAGIAAATVASFGASAQHHYSTISSFASVNTIVTGNSGFKISASDKVVSETDFKTATTELGSFAITLPQSAKGFSLKNIHAHNYPNGYAIKITPTTFGGNVCIATVGVSANDITPTINTADGSYQCTFTGEGSGALTLTNNATFGEVVTPGARTFTAEFVSYTD